MPNLTATRTYENNKSPVQADFDSFIEDIEIIVNTTKLDDDNFQDGGIDASARVIDGSVATTNIRNNNITTAKLAASAVTTAKIADGAVTTAKIASGAVTQAKCMSISGVLPIGATMMFHTYNGTVSTPRGWMPLDGDVVNETNYEATHGAGTYTTDGISGSTILNKYLPNMNDKYAIGVAATTKDGASAITSVGNSGHSTSFAHTHTYAHTHSIILTSDELAQGFNTNANVLAAGTNTTTSTTPSTNSQLGTVDHQPESIEVLFIMKVI